MARHPGLSLFEKQLPRRLLIALGVSTSALPAWQCSVRGAVPLRRLPDEADLQAALRSSARRVAQTWIHSQPAEDLAWSWGEGVLVFGLERTHVALNEPSLVEYLRRYLEHHQRLGLSLHSSDDTTPGLATIERVVHGDRQFALLATEVAEYHLESPRSPSGMILHLGDAWPDFVIATFPDVWVDSVFHVVPMLMRYSAFSGDPRFRDAGALQLRLFAQKLSDPASGFVTHAYDDSPDDSPVPPFEHGVFWARGNGWMLASLVDGLAHLPGDHAAYPELLRTTTRLERALRGVQRPSGLFGTLLQDEDSYEETAGSALILYAMACGVRLGLFGEETRAALSRGGRGLWAILRQRGSEVHVTGTSLGTNPVESLYARTPTADQVNYGVGAWLLAATEIAAVLGT